MSDNLEELDENLALYRSQVRNAVLADSTVPFPNKSPLHARIIVQEFVRAARESVDIFCGKLSNAVYGGKDTLGVFVRAMHLGVRVRVILQNGDKLENAQLARAIKENGGEVQMLTEDMKNETPTGHFFIVDGKRYRYEMDGEACRAFACANGSQDEFACRYLPELFDSYHDHSVPVNL